MSVAPNGRAVAEREGGALWGARSAPATVVDPWTLHAATATSNADRPSFASAGVGATAPLDVERLFALGGGPGATALAGPTVVLPGIDVPRRPAATGAPVSRLRSALFVASGWARNIGLIVLLFAAWQIWGTGIEHDYAQQHLRDQFGAEVRRATHAGTTTVPALLASNARVQTPPSGRVIGRIQIPAIGVDQYVVQGTTEADLAMGPGHYAGTSLPGQAGNIAIAGHRTTYGAPFNDLDELKVSDAIVLTTDAGQQFTYVVSAPPTAVSPQDVAVLDSGEQNELTLTTCTPRFSASQRLVVVALLSMPQSVVAAPVTPHRVRAGAEDGAWSLGNLPWAIVLVLGLVVLGAYHGRIRRRLRRIPRLAVLTPVWAAGLFLLFAVLTTLLPSNL